MASTLPKVENEAPEAPFLTAKEFSRRTGMPMRTIQDLVKRGLLPRHDPRPPGERDRKFPVYINMVKLRQQCAAGDDLAGHLNRH